MDYKILHRKLKTGDHHLKQGVNRKRTSSCSNSATLAMNMILSQEWGKLNIFMAIHNTDIPVNQIEMTTVQLLKWSFKSNHRELLVQYFFQQQSFITEILKGTRSLE